MVAKKKLMLKTSGSTGEDGAPAAVPAAAPVPDTAPPSSPSFALAVIGGSLTLVMLLALLALQLMENEHYKGEIVNPAISAAR